MDHAKKLAEALRPFIVGPVMHDKTLGDTRLVQAAEMEAAQAALAAYDAAPGWTPPNAWTDVLAERRRQVDVEGWHPARDDMYTSGELALAGAAYATASAYYHADPYAAVLSVWPWDRSWLKLTTPRRDLVKAAALILAEIERLDRATSAPLPGVA